MRPLDCFAALAMTGGELARLFLGVALVSWQRKFKLTHYPRGRWGGPCSTSTCQPREREDPGFHDRIRISRVALAAFLELRCLVVAPRLDTRFRGYDTCWRSRFMFACDERRSFVITIYCGVGSVVGTTEKV